MARHKDPIRERAWRQRLRQQSSSSLSIPAFCAREGISAAAFYAWRQRLAASSLPACPEPPLFVPVHRDSTSRQADPVPGHGVEIELPYEVRLRFDAPPEPEWLGRVVAALADLPRKEATP
jgi:hypothetical protein